MNDDISFLKHSGVCGGEDLSGDFWPGVSKIVESLVGTYLLVDKLRVRGGDAVSFLSSSLVSSFDGNCCNISSFAVWLL